MTPSAAPSSTRTRIAMIIVFMLVIAAFSGLYVFMQRVGAVRESQHKISFYEYVLQHHVGQLTDIDDGTGFNPNAYVLTLNHRIADTKIKEYALHLMKLYVMYDSGQSLTILYQPSPKVVAMPMADVAYNDDAKVVTVSLTNAHGVIGTSKLRVNW